MENGYNPDVVLFYVKQYNVRKPFCNTTSYVFPAKTIKHWIGLNGQQSNINGIKKVVAQSILLLLIPMIRRLDVAFSFLRNN